MDKVFALFGKENNNHQGGLISSGNLGLKNTTTNNNNSNMLSLFSSTTSSVAQRILGGGSTGNDEAAKDDDNEDVVDALSDDPHLSSAALCIRLNFANDTNHDDGEAIRPVYTHQCFEHEYIPGYQPYHKILKNAREKFLKSSSSRRQDNDDSLPLLLHASHEHHHHDPDAKGGTNKELLIRVTLAPSCRQSYVEFDTNNDDETQLRGSNDRKRDQPTKYDDGIDESSSASERLLVKRIKGGGGTGVACHYSGSDTIMDGGSTTKNSSMSVSYSQQPSTTITTNSEARMSKEDILKCLDCALPRRSSSLIDVTNDYLTQPIGHIVHEYSVAVATNNNNSNNDAPTTTTETMDFCLYLADPNDNHCSDVEEYHNQVQKLALFWIETAESVDICNDQSGYWKVLYLFQKHTMTKNETGEASSSSMGGENPEDEGQEGVCQYSLAGFMTLFHFHAPFHKPVPGTIVRICQALILPHYQRQGHGKRMMHFVYDKLAQNQGRDSGDAGDGGLSVKSIVNNSISNENIVMVNVEDPAPGFVALRNKVDFEYLQKHKDWLDLSEEASTPTNNDGKVDDINDPNFFMPLSEAQVRMMSIHAKIIPRQIHIAYELLKLKSLKEYIQSSSKSEDTKTMEELEQPQQQKSNVEDLEKRFRLLVKKRLNKESREELAAFSTVPEKQAFLAQLFDEELKHYESILGRSR